MMVKHVSEAINQYFSVYSVCVFRDPSVLSAIALVAARPFEVSALPERPSERYNIKIQKPLVDVMGLRHVQGETFESIITRAKTGLDDVEFWGLEDKELILETEYIDPAVIHEIDTEAFISAVRIGGNKVTYDEAGTYHVPMQSIVTALVETYGRKALKVSEELEFADAVQTGLQELTLNQEEMEPLLLAVGIGVWKVSLEHQRGELFIDYKQDGDRRDDWIDHSGLMTVGEYD